MSANRLIAIGSALIGLQSLGCTHSVEAVFDRDADFARLRSFAFSTDAPLAEARDEELAVLIRDGLLGRGYVRSQEQPDFTVGYRLVVAKRLEQVRVPRASYLLSSHDSTPSYLISGTATEERLFEYVLLTIEIADRWGELVWKGVFRDRLEPGMQFDLEGAVADLIRRFPSRPLRLPRQRKAARGWRCTSRPQVRR